MARSIPTETEKVAPAEEFRQGDILRVQSNNEGTDHPHLGVIINADCDLAHGKLDGAIAYLPIYSFDEFFSRFYAPIAVKNEKKNTLKYLQDILGLDDEESGNLERWLASTEPEVVAEGLYQTLDIGKKYHEQVLSRLIKLRNCIDAAASPLEVFKRFCAHDKAPESYARTHIIEAKKTTADGHLFISEITSESGLGFVVRMRRIYTLAAENVFTSYAESQTFGADLGETAVRIARFSSLYRFRIAQLFALQFTRIGLPDELIELGDLAISDLISQLSRGT